jgi:hypothetical protein
METWPQGNFLWLQKSEAVGGGFIYKATCNKQKLPNM